MLEETLRALVAMEYPHDTWVLDERDDDEVRALCAALGAHHFTRKGIPRYQEPEGRFAARSKHGNYNAWLTEVGFERYDVIAAFDPDHVPEAEFLSAVLGYFDDPSVGYVQAAQAYYNQAASFIARGAAEETYLYYSSIQMTAYALGYPIVVGSHNTHRTAALRDVGGFAPRRRRPPDRSSTARAGWRGVYVPLRLAAGITPVDWGGYLTQQRRWARSVIDVKLRLLPKLGGRLLIRERLTSFMQGLYYLNPLFIALGMGVLVDAGHRRHPGGLLVRYRSRARADAGRARRLRSLPPAVLSRSPARDGPSESVVVALRKWPHLLLALFDVVLARSQPYVLTEKLGTEANRHPVARAHLPIVCLVAAAWGSASRAA